MLHFCFDVDGVILDFEKLFFESLCEQFNLGLPENHQSTCWNFSDILTEEQTYEGWDHFINSPRFSQLPPLVSSESFHSCFGAYPVHFITNIPSQYLKAREVNLGSLGFPIDSIHTGGFVSFEGTPTMTKAERIQELLKGDDTVFFIDDHPKNCENVLDHVPGSHVLLMSRRFNQDFERAGITRVDDWNTILELANALKAPVV